MGHGRSEGPWIGRGKGGGVGEPRTGSQNRSATHLSAADPPAPVRVTDAAPSARTQALLHAKEIASGGLGERVAFKGGQSLDAPSRHSPLSITIQECCRPPGAGLGRPTPHPPQETQALLHARDSASDAWGPSKGAWRRSRWAVGWHWAPARQSRYTCGKTPRFHHTVLPNPQPGEPTRATPHAGAGRQA